MIVNIAYPYMTKSEPANPVIFQGNEVNYPYTGVNFEMHGRYITMNAKAELEFSDLDLTDFTKLSVQGMHNFSSGLEMSAVFIDASGNISPSVKQNYPAASRTTRVWDIPQEFRTKKCRVKFTTNNSSSLDLYFATLS